MDSIEVTPDQKYNMDAHALEIFTDCANAGLPFQDCISAVWFSGVAFAVCAAKPQTPASAAETGEDRR